MIIYTTADSDSDLQGIIELQRQNLVINLSQSEIESQGFVTVVHSPDSLKSLNEIEKHIVAKDGNRIVAYLLAMTKLSKNEIPILFPMFQLFDKISFHNRPVSSYNYMVVGQVCVDKQYRGQGVLDKAFSKYKEQFGDNYDFAITEIALSNRRSLNAHRRIGFTEIHQYADPNKTEWAIVLWDWENNDTPDQVRYDKLR